MTVSWLKMKVAAVHAAPGYMDKEASTAKVNSIKDAGEQGIKLLAFPESFIPGTRYVCCLTQSVIYIFMRIARFLQAQIYISDRRNSRRIIESADQNIREDGLNGNPPLPTPAPALSRTPVGPRGVTVGLGVLARRPPGDGTGVLAERGGSR